MRVNKLGIFIIILALAFVVLVAVTSKAQAQTYVGGGASVIRSSSYDPSPASNKDGGSTFPGGYVEAGLKLPANFQARVLGEYSGTPQLPTIFTTDEGSRKAIGEFRIRPELRYQFNPESIVRPFVAGGVDYYHQRFETIHSEPDPLPDPLPAYYEEDEEYGGGIPSSGLNPFVSFGVAVGERHEASFSRLFEDYTNLNPSKLSGYRASYFYTRPVYKGFSVKAGVEADYLRFRETNGFGYIDNYFEHDPVIKVRVGFTFGGGK